MMYIIQTNVRFTVPSYQCPNCYRLYTYSRGLARHIKYECGVEWKFPCVMCNRPFKRKEHLRRHMIFIHKQHYI